MLSMPFRSTSESEPSRNGAECIDFMHSVTASCSNLLRRRTSPSVADMALQKHANADLLRKDSRVVRKVVNSQFRNPSRLCTCRERKSRNQEGALEIYAHVYAVGMKRRPVSRGANLCGFLGHQLGSNFRSSLILPREQVRLC